MYSDEYYVAKAMHNLSNGGLIAHEYRGYCSHDKCVYKTRRSEDEATIKRLAGQHAYKFDHKVGIVDHGIVVNVVGHVAQSALDELPDW